MNRRVQCTEDAQIDKGRRSRCTQRKSKASYSKVREERINKVAQTRANHNATQYENPLNTASMVQEMMQPILVLEMKQLKRKMTNLSNLNNWI